jgi:outer membrane protein OmpA-like peptidoglycan-associated protein
MRTKTTLAAVAAVSVALGTGCAPRTNRALERAEAAYQQAAGNSDIAQNAPVALHEADQALERARREWAEHKDEKDTNALAYVAERRVDIARAVAERKKAEDEAQALDQDREKVLLEARTGEARRERARVRQLEQQLHARQTERGMVVTFGDVLFETDSAVLRPGAMRDLQRLVAVLRQEPGRQVTIEGHTDSTGSADYNRRLSEERADAVRDALVTNGIDPARITARGLGESYPVASNATSAGRQQNRRVEVIIASGGATAGAGRQPPATREEASPESGATSP